MKNTAPFVCLLLVLLMASCKKDKSPAAVTVNPPDNAAPHTWFTFNVLNFTTIQVITSQDYNEVEPSCTPESFLKTIHNTKGNGQQFTVGCASALMGSPLCTEQGLQTSNVQLSCNSIHLYLNGGCAIPFPTPMTTGYSDTSVMGSLSRWATYNGDTLVWTYTDSGAVPVIADILSGDSVSTVGSYTMNAVGNVTGDSVIFSITGPKTIITHVLGANTSSYTFTSAEMASLGTTSGNKTGLLQIAPYNFHTQIIDGASCYFIKETCLSKYVILH